jgi:hypothetical protein
MKSVHASEKSFMQAAYSVSHKGEKRRLENNLDFVKAVPMTQVNLITTVITVPEK